VPTNVRYASDSDHLRHEAELTLSANAKGRHSTYRAWRAKFNCFDNEGTRSLTNVGGFDLHLPLRFRRHFANGCCNSPSLYSGGYRMTCFPLVMY